jgi:lactate permease
MDYLIAFLPIISLIFFMVVLEKPAYIGGPISLLITLIIAIFYLNMDFSWIGASIMRGSLISFDIILIIAGVFLLVSILKQSNAFYSLRVLTHKISSDARIQVIFLAWFSIAFLEGIAGFGTPAMIIAPILIILGFSPLAAISASLIGDSVACTFGATGTPILVGIVEGVSTLQISTLGPNFIDKVSILTSTFHLMVGSLVPFFIVCIVSYIHTKSIRKALDVFKLCIFSGFLFLVPSLFINYLMGPEFPSIIGSLIGAMLFVITIKLKIFLPKEKWIIEEDEEFLAKKEADTSVDYLRAIFPYFITMLMLIVTRMNIEGIGTLLKTLRLSFNNILGTDVSYILYPLYSPGFFFMISAILAFYVYKMSDRKIETVLIQSSKKILKTFIALVSILSIVQIMIYSANNSSGHVGIITQISDLFTHTGFMWPLFSPLLGLLGAFVAGSSTVSNLMFSSIQVDTSLAIGMSPILGLALQGVGSAVGNMFAIHNIIAVGAVIHLLHPEGKVIKYTIIPAIIIAVIAGIIGLIISLN